VNPPEPDTTRDPRLEEIALRMADDRPVDWEEARQTGPDLSDTLERLRQIQVIADEHREPDGEPVGGPPGDTIAFTWGGLAAIERIGEGGFGEVWRAWDPALGREVALKIRRPGAGSGDARWLREARSLARVRHPHVITVHGADVHDGRAGIWTDLIAGRTLEEVLMAIGPLGAREAAAIGLDLCAALASVHAAGLVHGDLKTRNVMREGRPSGDARGEAGSAGRIVLMDFGSAHEPRVSETGGGSPGTPLFAAPELLAGGSPSVASDLYALGVVLYRLVTARFPVEAARVTELSDRLARGEIVPLRTRRPDLPPAFVQVVDRAIARDPARRFPDAAHMERALAAAAGAMSTEPVRAGKPWALVGAGVAIGALVVGLGWLAALTLPRLLQPRFGLESTAPHPVATVRQTLSGDRKYGALGFAVCVPGDIDGDGLPDLLISTGGSRPDQRSNAVRFFRGLPDGTFGEPVDLSVEPSALFGYTITALGDVNGDGKPDFAIADPGELRRDPGTVYVYFGGRVPGQSPDRVLRGPRVGQDFGYAVAAGDLNGDGINDLVVGAPTDDAIGRNTGRVYVYWGGRDLGAKPDVELSTVVVDSQYGAAVAVVPDLDGDGVSDLAVGANWDPAAGPRGGRVFIYRGGRSMRTTPERALTSPAAEAWFGSAIAAGDLNGDGVPDLAIGAGWADGFEEGSGNVYVYPGGHEPADRPALVLRGPKSGSRFGEHLAVGDVDGDGVADLIVGAPTLDRGPGESGAVYAYRGGRGFHDRPEFEIAGDGVSKGFGTSLALVTGPATGGGTRSVHVTTAGNPRLVIGAPNSEPAGRESGAAYLVELKPARR
jgi:Protein kinase domain/FG-GAP repeat/FG-GAP-like repeat